ncbi:MAG: hypothetical protein N4A33_11390 [Bacteriovoracaceae bacterium]|jgi:hypothetical protein|nr:hypothetical protein [Bacteriovoracaceae bacterium]
MKFFLIGLFSINAITSFAQDRYACKSHFYSNSPSEFNYHKILVDISSDNIELDLSNHPISKLNNLKIISYNHDLEYNKFIKNNKKIKFVYMTESPEWVGCKVIFKLNKEKLFADINLKCANFLSLTNDLTFADKTLSCKKTK